jgi:predicted dehydrogenase
VKKTKIGIIGVGYLGRFHLEKYLRMEEVELCGVADIRPDRLKEITGQFQIPGTLDYRELIPQVDAVSIVVPTQEHGSIARDCLEAGVQVLIEKPITSTLAEAEELIALAGRRGCLIQVGHLERFNPAYLKVRHLIHQPLFIETHRLSPFKERGIDVNVVLDLMIHDLDLILHLIASPPENVQAVGVPVISNQVDIANARIQFQNGGVANITASRISIEAMRKLRIFQPGAYLSLDLGAKAYRLVRLEKGAAQDSPGMPFVFEEGSFSEQDALELELRSFIRSVQEGIPPLVSGEDGRKALALALEINREIEKNCAPGKSSWIPEKIPELETIQSWLGSETKGPEPPAR